MNFLNTNLIKLAAVGLVGFATTSTASTASTAWAQTAPSKEKPAAMKKEDGSAKKTDAAPSSDKKSEMKSETPLKFTVAQGKYRFTAPGTWESVPPKHRMLEFEIKVPKEKADKRDGRLTIMSVGGSIKANIARWEGQFAQTDGEATKAKVTETTVQNMKVTMTDISGTYVETMGGPFSGGKKVKTPDFRVLAAIIETPESGNYFFKLVGPKATIDANQQAFESTIKTLAVKE